MSRPTQTWLVLFVLAVLLGLGWLWKQHNADSGAPPASAAAAAAPVPVETAPVSRGSIALRRTFSGTLESSAEFTVAPKVGGRLERLHAQIADPVRKGQIVAVLDDDEFAQTVKQSEADLAVAKARVVEAKNSLEISTRNLERIQALREKGIESESQLDTMAAEALAKQAGLEVAQAQAIRAQAALDIAKTRLGYTQIGVSWDGSDEERVVARRFAEEGDTVSANTALLSIVRLDPIRCIIYVPEKDYGLLSSGQETFLTTDAHPGHTFPGKIARIAPVFHEASRQARVEIDVANAAARLKPGMFARVEIVLRRVENATLVPADALTVRNGKAGVFLASSGSPAKAAWRPVEVGIQDGPLVEIRGEGIEGRVITLGQQSISDGSAIAISDPPRQENDDKKSP